MINRRRLTSLGIFSIGVALAVLLVRLPVGHELVDRFEGWGYMTALIGGVLYTTSLTSAAATVVLAHVSETLNPVLAAVVGGFGALLYDLIVFTAFDRATHHPGVIENIRQRLAGRRKTRWSAYLLGSLVVASPLPDELGLAMLDVAGIKKRALIPLSFGLNTIGILAIISLF
ncbi:MAG: hypothetical protein HY421_02285 [Candidatus Kerfeldbacteria bacterium]|nr:hypothetical protein [Candidatus Kerfeldbacteria bacterium]